MPDNLYENEYYKVMETEDALGEDNHYGRAGYAVINKETGVAEHTTTLLPQAIFQSDALCGALAQFNNPEEDVESIESTDEDIILN